MVFFTNCSSSLLFFCYLSSSTRKIEHSSLQLLYFSFHRPSWHFMLSRSCSPRSSYPLNTCFTPLSYVFVSNSFTLCASCSFSMTNWQFMCLYSSYLALRRCMRASHSWRAHSKPPMPSMRVSASLPTHKTTRTPQLLDKFISDRSLTLQSLNVCHHLLYLSYSPNGYFCGLFAEAWDEHAGRMVFRFELWAMGVDALHFLLFSNFGNYCHHLI